jgi:hypothetical protein
MFIDLCSRGACRPHFRQLATYHLDFGQREQSCKLGGVFRQTTISRLGGSSPLVGGLPRSFSRKCGDLSATNTPHRTAWFISPANSRLNSFGRQTHLTIGLSNSQIVAVVGRLGNSIFG